MAKLEIKCSCCNSIFLKERAEYNRRIKNGCSNFYCSKECINKTFTKKIYDVEVSCIYCNKYLLPKLQNILEKHVHKNAQHCIRIHFVMKELDKNKKRLI